MEPSKRQESKSSATDLNRKVREFRVALGDTQQQFANRLGLAISTVVRYESTRPPTGEFLERLIRVAKENGLKEYKKAFRDAEPGGEIPMTIEEGGLVNALLDLLRNRQLPEVYTACQDLQLELERCYGALSKAAASGREIFGVDAEAVEYNQDTLRHINNVIRMKRMLAAGETVDSIAKKLDMPVRHLERLMQAEDSWDKQFGPGRG